MGRRLDLQAKLVDLLGASHVYFQPPPNVQMVYPCIVYSKDSEKKFHANDNPYLRRDRYTLTVIDKRPDSPVSEALSQLPMCSFDRSFRQDNLNHDVYQLFF